MPIKELNKQRSRTPPRERIGYIDSLKGFAVSTMVLGHVTGGYRLTGMYPGHPSVEILYRTIYSFHMALFMLISGYLFYAAYFDSQGQPKKKRMRRQILNLIIIYIIYDIVFSLFKAVCSRFTVDPVTWHNALLFPVLPTAHHWYIYVLILYYIFFSQRVIYQQSRITFCTTLLLGAVSIFVDVSLFSLSKFLFFAFFFWVGACYRKGTATWFSSKVVTAVLFTVSVALFILTYGTDIPAKVPGIKTMIALGISQGIWYAFEHISVLKTNQLLSCLGRYSLEIYLLSPVFTTGARTVFPDFILDHYVLSVALNFTLGTAIPFMFAYCCKKLSVYDLFFKPVTWLEKRKQA